MPHHYADKLPAVPPGTTVFKDKQSARTLDYRHEMKTRPKPGETCWINDSGELKEAVGCSYGTWKYKAKQSAPPFPVGAAMSAAAG